MIRRSQPPPLPPPFSPSTANLITSLVARDPSPPLQTSSRAQNYRPDEERSRLKDGAAGRLMNFIYLRSMGREHGFSNNVS